jgi:hypothetical protein
MEYVRDHGAFADVPFELIVREFRKSYPEFFSEEGEMTAGSFDEEALRERKR